MTDFGYGDRVWRLSRLWTAIDPPTRLFLSRVIGHVVDRVVFRIEREAA